jgi:hypothetical protein
MRPLGPHLVGRAAPVEVHTANSYLWAAVDLAMADDAARPGHFQWCVGEKWEPHATQDPPSSYTGRDDPVKLR